MALAPPHSSPRLCSACCVRILASRRVELALRSGRLDVAFVENSIDGRGLVTIKVGTLSRGLWCGPEHPLYRAGHVTAETLAECVFLAPPPDARGLPVDGWPAERARRIGLTVDQLRVGVDLCAQLPLLAVLPDVLAQAHAGRLWRLPCDFLAAGEVHAIHLRSLSGRPNAVAALLAALA